MACACDCMLPFLEASRDGQNAFEPSRVELCSMHLTMLGLNITTGKCFGRFSTYPDPTPENTFASFLKPVEGIRPRFLRGTRQSAKEWRSLPRHRYSIYQGTDILYVAETGRMMAILGKGTVKSTTGFPRCGMHVCTSAQFSNSRPTDAQLSYRQFLEVLRRDNDVVEIGGEIYHT